MARPPKEINWEVVEKLIECGCNGVEIASKFRIHPENFYLRFQEEYGCNFTGYVGKSREAGIADIKAMLHAKALNNSAPGNSNLLIFLARCKLGMREPLVANDTAPNQSQIDQSHIIMKLEHRISELEEQINGTN